MGQRSRPVSGLANGYQCVDDDRARHDPPFCPTGMCAVYPLDPPKPQPTCEEKCEELRKLCHELVPWYTRGLGFAGGLVGAGGGAAAAGTGAAGGVVVGEIVESATGGMNTQTLKAGCE